MENQFERSQGEVIDSLIKQGDLGALLEELHQLYIVEHDNNHEPYYSTLLEKDIFDNFISKKKVIDTLTELLKGDHELDEFFEFIVSLKGNHESKLGTEEHLLNQENALFIIRSESQYQEHKNYEELRELIPLYLRCFNLIQIEKEEH